MPSAINISRLSIRFFFLWRRWWRAGRGHALWGKKKEYEKGTLYIVLYLSIPRLSTREGEYFFSTFSFYYSVIVYWRSGPYGGGTQRYMTRGWLTGPGHLLLCCLLLSRDAEIHTCINIHVDGRRYDVRGV